MENFRLGGARESSRNCKPTSLRQELGSCESRSWAGHAEARGKEKQANKQTNNLAPYPPTPTPSPQPGAPCTCGSDEGERAGRGPVSARAGLARGGRVSQRLLGAVIQSMCARVRARERKISRLLGARPYLCICSDNSVSADQGPRKPAPSLRIPWPFQSKNKEGEARGTSSLHLPSDKSLGKHKYVFKDTPPLTKLKCFSFKPQQENPRDETNFAYFSFYSITC